MLRLAPIATVLLVAGPVAAGLIFTLLPAFGVMPSIGRTQPSLSGWAALVAAPGFPTALRLTLTTGTTATLLSFGLAVAFAAEALTRPGWRWMRAILAGVLASPHSAIALGLAFLVAPSGWIVRLLSPWATGWQDPPAGLVTLRDPLGVTLVIGLVLKETPYLVLMIVAASAQVPARALLATAGALGQRPAVAWLKVVFPLLYRQIRLPVFAVLAFSLSVVDVALVLAPGNPPPLAVLAVRWLTNDDLDLYVPAAAAAMLVTGIVLAAGLVWWLAERPVARLARAWAERGGPSRLVHLWIWLGARLAVGLGGAAAAAIAGLVLWSAATAWRFPDALPSGFGLATWSAQARHATETAGTTVLVGSATAAVAVALALLSLEHGQHSRAIGRGRALGRTAEAVIMVPLLVPQVAFLFGVQFILVRFGLDGTLLAVAWAHFVFVLPYVALSLVDPFAALDPRFAASAAALGAGPARIFGTIKLPLLLRPILVAAAVGFGVSIAQYLPTLFAGAGRVATVTTEAVTLSSGGDRRVIGVFAVLQAALPLVGYGLAFLGPAVLFRRRRGMA